MPTRTTPTPTITFPDLRACTGVAAIFDLFRRLRYPVAMPPTAVPLDEGDLPGGLRDGIAARYPIA
jgi:hypothetical protein